MSPERSDSIDTASSTDSEGSSVDSLLPELLEAIFHRLALSVSSKDSLESPNPSRIHPLALICRHWREPVQRTLQRFVRLGTPRQAISYGNFLRNHPHARDRLNRLDALNETGLSLCVPVHCVINVHRSTGTSPMHYSRSSPRPKAFDISISGCCLFRTPIASLIVWPSCTSCATSSSSPAWATTSFTGTLTGPR